MAAGIEELRAQVAAVEGELREAEASAVAATPAELGGIGSLIAGLRAKLAGLREALSAAMTFQQRKAEAEAAKASARAREEAIAGVRAKQADLEARTAAFFAGLIDAEDQVIDLWAEWDRIKSEERELVEEAAALGVSAPLGVATPERVREIARGRSAYLRWRPGRMQRHARR